MKVNGLLGMSYWMNAVKAEIRLIGGVPSLIGVQKIVENEEDFEFESVRYNRISVTDMQKR